MLRLRQIQVRQAREDGGVGEAEEELVDPEEARMEMSQADRVNAAMARLQSTAAAADEVEAVAEAAEKEETEHIANPRLWPAQETEILPVHNHHPSPAVEASLGIV